MNKFKTLTQEFVKKMIDPKDQGRWYKDLGEYFGEISEKIKPSYQDLCENPKESIVWCAAKLCYLMVTVECNLADESIHNSCLDMASNIAVKELSIIVKVYYKEMLEVN